MKKILVVEDDKRLAELLQSQLSSRGFKPFSCNSIAEAKTAIDQQSFDLAIVDIGLPDGNGFTLAQYINDKIKTMPFIFLTAMNSPEFRLEGYELGASDYIPKPFHMKELALRIERIIGTEDKRRILINDGLKLDPDTLKVSINNTSIDLTLAEREFSLLYYLIENTPKIITRDEIINLVWKRGEKANLRTVDNLVVKLRQLLDDNYSKRLVSVRGVGYQWVNE